jgi:hypothetical protein
MYLENQSARILACGNTPLQAVLSSLTSNFPRNSHHRSNLLGFAIEIQGKGRVVIFGFHDEYIVIKTNLALNFVR